MPFAALGAPWRPLAALATVRTMTRNADDDLVKPLSVTIGLTIAPRSQSDVSGPIVRIEPSSRAPLRLNNAALDLHGKTDATDAFSRIKEYLLTLCGPWSRHHHLFVERYFAFIDAQCERHREELTEILAPFGSVYDYRDFRFSAWLPLPLAVVTATATTQPAADAPPRADFLFWSGTAFTVVELCGHTSRSMQRIRDREQFRQAGIEVVDLPLDALRTDPGPLFTSAFPPAFSRFWRGEPFPSGPLKPDAARFVLPPTR